MYNQGQESRLARQRSSESKIIRSKKGKKTNAKGRKKKEVI